MIDDVEAEATTHLTTGAVRSNTHSISKSPTSSSPSTSLDRRKRAPPTFHFLAGLVTGSLSAILLQPADLLKTRVQQARGTSVGGALREILSQPRAVRQLWRGALPSVIRTGFGSALYFWSLNALRATWTRRQTNSAAADAEREGTGQRTGGDMKEELGRIANLATANRQTIQSIPGPALDSTIAVHTPPSQTQTPIAGSASRGSSSSAAPTSSSALPKLSNTVNLVAGALARGGAGLIMMPVTVLKVRYESSLYNSYGSAVGLVGATRAIVAREGIRGLYAGYGATLIRDAPHAGLYVLFYEQAKRTFSRFGQSPSSSSTPTAIKANTVNFVSGIVAAAAATAVTNPFDAIKTRIQLMPDRYRNMPQAAAVMLRGEGPRALFDGLGIRMARKAMSSALAWTIYEDLVRRAEARYEAASS